MLLCENLYHEMRWEEEVMFNVEEREIITKGTHKIFANVKIFYLVGDIIDEVSNNLGLSINIYNR